MSSEVAPVPSPSGPFASGPSGSLRSVPTPGPLSRSSCGCSWTAAASGLRRRTCRNKGALSARPCSSPPRFGRVVFVLTTHYLPGYKAGGPIRTIRNLVGSLGDEFDLRIFPSDHDFAEPTAYGGVHVNDWNRVEGALVFYADAAARRPTRLAATLRQSPHAASYLRCS